MTGIDIGGRLTSSIKVTQKKTGDQYKVGFFIKGEANLFALTGKMDMNASVGEDIQITNYDSKIKLVCMPPIPPPTSEKDFYDDPPPDPENPPPPNITVDKNFAEALDKEKHFVYWTTLPSNPMELIGLPIKFTLSPIDRYLPPGNLYLPPEGDNKRSKLLEDDPSLKEFEGLLCILRDWAGTDCIKRRIMQKLRRIQKILHEPEHVFTVDTVEEEVKLRELAEEKRLDGLKLFTAWKEKLFLEGNEEERNFKEMVRELAGITEAQEAAIVVFVNNMITRSKAELDAVNITTPAIREGEEEEEEQEFDGEEKSPLIYFTSQTALTAWQKTQRFCKLLYSAYIPEDGAPPPEGESIPQRIYNMSERLGTVYIQPAISYPTLSEKIARERKKFRAEDQELFSINTPNGTLSYTRSDVDLVKIHFVLDLLTALTGMGGEADTFSRMGHLYITYCELHGIKLNISHTIDVIPLIRLLEGMFGSLAITHTLTSTKNEIENREDFTLIFTQDGVQSSRHVVYALLQLGQTAPNLKNGDVLCATFDIINVPDVPPLLLSWDKQVKGVCLDHLDLLVLLDLYKKEEKWDVDQISKYLGIGQFDQSPLCTTDRVLFSQYVRQMSSFPTRTVSNKDLNPLVDILTAVLTATVQGPKDLANVATRYAIKLLGADYDPGDIPSWDPNQEEYIIETGNSTAWGEIATHLGMIWSSKPRFAYYNALFLLFGEFQLYASPIPVPEIIEDEEDEEIPEGLREEETATPTPAEQYDTLDKSLLKEFPSEISDTFRNEVDLIHGLRTLHSKGCARLYTTALSREVGRIEQRIGGDEQHQEKATKIQIVKHLKGIVSEIQSSATVPDHLCHALLEFTASVEIPETSGDEDPPENQKYPPEILYRLRTSLKLKRYYHMLSDLVENTPEKFDILQLSHFQLEMYRLVSITDWLNLIRLIQEISTFEQVTLERIWSNAKFQYLIRANLNNDLVLRALAKGFVKPGQNTVPKYIPRDIAKAILSINLSPEGNPIGFEPIWTSKAVLIKSLQILWVLKVIPEQFQLYLLRNTVAEDGIVYEALKDVDALLYWNEEKKYFDQIWDLATIYEVILRLMGQYEAKLIKNRSNKPHEIYQFQHKKSTVVSSSTRRRTELITVSQFLTMTKSPPAQDNPDFESKIMRLLYHLKLMKMSSLQGSYNPFVLTERVDTLTHLLSRAEGPLQTELLTIIGTKFSSQFAIPLTICNSTSPQTFISFTYSLLLEPYKSAQLPKIITAIRIGPDTPEGKSHFLNSMCTLNLAAFASKSNSTPGDIPQYLEGFIDVIKINETTGNPVFLDVLFRNGKPEEFYVLNVHGDALKNPQHLKLIQTVTSSFMVFWNPQNWSSVVDKKQELLNVIKPSHATVHLYIDPTEDTIEEIEQSEIIRKPFATPTPENLNNCGKAVATALLRRPKQPNLSSNADPTPAITFPTKHPVAVDTASWIHTSSTKVIKSSLILQQGWKHAKTEAELDSHWTSDPFYATLITKLVQILEHSEEEYRTILSDLAELLTPTSENEDMATTAWKNLGSLTHQEFGHTSFGAVTPTTVTKQQHLLGYLQNDIDTARLNVTDLLTELCKIYELSPAKLPFNPVPIMTTLFQSNSSALPVPSVPSAGFFTEKWSQEFISNLEDTSVFVMNCVGTDAFQISGVVNSIFGISFTSTSSRSGWSETPWSGLFMRLIILSDEITDQTGIRSILLLHAKPLCATTANGHPTLTQRDQQLSTFLLATSNLSLIFDFDLTSFEYTAILETSLIALNKVDIDDKTPRLFFIGLTVPQLGGSEILTMLDRTKRMAESWIDYGDISTLGHRVILSALQDVNDNPGSVIFDLTLYPTLIPLSDAIITAVTNLKDECPKLPDFLTELGPIWTHIRDKVPFPHPNFDEMTRSEKFYAALHELLNLIDDAFNFHVEDFPTSIFSEMSNIINAWVTKEEGEVSVPTKKDNLWSRVSAYVNKMWEDCEMNEEDEQCVACKNKEIKQKEILDEWPPWETEEPEPEPDTRFTQIKFTQLVEEYISWERWHYVNLAKEMMTAFEMRLLAQEEETYIEEEDDPEFSPVQKASLEVKIIDSERRLRQEMVSLFPGVDMAWDENEDGFDYLKTTPAFADPDNPLMNEEEAQKLRDLLVNLPTIEVRLGGHVGIYQGGMVRRTMSTVETAAVLKFEQEVGKKIINNFRLKVVSHTVWRLNKILNTSQNWWKKDHDPLVIYLASLL